MVLLLLYGFIDVKQKPCSDARTGVFFGSTLLSQFGNFEYDPESRCDDVQDICLYHRVYISVRPAETDLDLIQ